MVTSALNRIRKMFQHSRLRGYGRWQISTQLPFWLGN